MRRRLGIAPDAPVVVCTARMVRRKGQDTLVRAWPQVLRRLPDARLLLVGDGPDRHRIERLVRRRGVENSVVITGGAPWHEIPAYTDAGDAFAMPCRTRLGGLEPEAFGIVFLEARACGLPVLAGDSGGASEAAGNRAVVVSDSDPAGLSGALVQLMKRGKGRDREPVEDWGQSATRLRGLLETEASGTAR